MRKTNERQMTVFPANRTALFIDGANLHSTAKTLGLIYFMGERRYPDRRKPGSWPENR
jgi:hypothetical protein